MSAHPGTRVEGHEAVGLGFGRIDHLPDVNTHEGVNPLELVDQGDVDEAENVFGQLDGLGRITVLDRHELVDRVAVEFEGALETCGGKSTDHFRNMTQDTVGIARILAFRGEGEVEIHAGLETRSLFEHGPQFFAGCSRVGAGFERDKHAAAQVGRNLFAGGKDMGQIGVLVAAQRSRYADDHGGAFRNAVRIVGKVQSARGERPGNLLRGKMGQRRMAVLQLAQSSLVSVESEYPESGFDEAKGEGYAHVAEADYGDIIMKVGGLWYRHKAVEGDRRSIFAPRSRRRRKTYWKVPTSEQTRRNW